MFAGAKQNTLFVNRAACYDLRGVKETPVAFPFAGIKLITDFF